MYTMGMSGTKWDIFLAALDLFAREGFHNVSVTQVANAAGIRASSIYNHYPCKDALLEAMYRYYNDCSGQHLPRLETLLEQLHTRSPMDTLRRIVLDLEPQTEQIMNQILLVAVGMPSDVRAKMLVHKNIFQIPRDYLTGLLTGMVDRQLIAPLDVEGFVFLYCSVYHSVSMRSTTSSGGPQHNWVHVADQLLRQFVVPLAKQAAG